jgi:hypothetical protein
VLRAAGETETTQGNIQDWLKLDEGDPGFQLLKEEEISAVISYFYLFSCPIYLFSKSFICLLDLSFVFINPDYPLVWMTSPPINPD